MEHDESAPQWAEDPDVILERPEPTGVERVDAVVGAITAVGQQALPEQVAAYERAHLELRGVLDDPSSAGT